MNKTYDPSSVEDKWFAAWRDGELFSAVEHSSNPPYSIVIPPPNVTGALHMGHALNDTVQDILVRWKRMSGFETMWMPGTDHAGIATQAVVEKRLFELEKKTRHDLGREALVKRIWDWKDEYEKRITGQLQKLGCSCDWGRQRFTLDPVCTRAVRYTFFSLFRKGLIYRGMRLVNWDTHLHTAVADDEIFYETVKGSMWYFRYPLDGGGFLPVATTRPETILGDTAVAVHPDDERYRGMIGRTAKVPFVDRDIPVIGDAELVDPAFGTGCVKVTPAHDPHDYQTGLRHGLPMVNILTEDGRINGNGGPFAGLDRYECRERLVEGLRERGLLDRIDPYETQVGHSDRSKTPIEPFLSSQWFVKMGDLAESAMEAVRDGRVKFFPERFARSYLDWLGEKRDWCISRQLWWGHQIPIWSCDTCSESDLSRAFAGRDDIAWTPAENRWLVCVREGDLPADALGAPHRLVRDPDVLDTWFSSALWPHSTMGWPEATGTLKAFYPTSVLVTNRDIISLWVARMVILGLENTGTAPFHRVYIHTTVMDGKGQRMSKSKGNGVDPLDIIEKYGADALRYTMAGMCTDNQDARLPVKEEKLSDGRVINVSEKFEVGRNFANKLWNASRFVLGNIETPIEVDGLPPRRRLKPADLWILSRLNRAAGALSDALELYRFSEAAHLLYDFTWHDFCDWYLEMKKPELYDGDTQDKADARALCGHVLAEVLKLLHPFMPFVTEEIWSHLRQKVHYDKVIDHEFVMRARFPAADASWIDESVESRFGLLQEVITALRTIRAESNVPPDKKGHAVIVPQRSEDVQWLESQAGCIAAFARLSETTVDAHADKPHRAGQAVVRGGVQVFLLLEGLIDVQVEIGRLEKEIARSRKLIEGAEGRLNSGSFVGKAPKEVVEKEKEKLEGLRLNLEKMEKYLAALKS